MRWSTYKRGFYECNHIANWVPKKWNSAINNDIFHEDAFAASETINIINTRRKYQQPFSEPLRNILPIPKAPTQFQQRKEGNILFLPVHPTNVNWKPAPKLMKIKNWKKSKVRWPKRKLCPREALKQY